MTFSGGLRGLRPPATFWQPFRLLEVSQLYECPLMGLLVAPPVSSPGANAWARENVTNELRRPPRLSQTGPSAIHHGISRSSFGPQRFVTQLRLQPERSR